MCNRTTTFSLFLVLLISCIPVMAFGPTNSRLLGFSGAGVAVVPLEGQTAISINPAAPGFMKQRQINFNLDYGTGERATHWFRVDEYGNTDSRGLGAGAEFYFPLGPLNLFFGLGSEFETVESEGTTWHHTYHPVDDKLSSTSTKPHLGLACSFSDVVSVGAQLLYWHNDSTYELADDFEFEFDARLLTGELGVLVTTPINLNFGLTWSTEDGKADRDEIWVGQASYAHECFYGMPSTLRIGAAYQKKAGSWLAGVEYVIVDDLDLELVIRDHHLTNTFPGEKHVTVYGEYWIGNLGLRGGAGRRVMDDTSYDNDYWRDFVSPVDSDSWVFSAGCTYKKSGNMGFDLFLQRIDGDGATQISTFDEEYWRLGFGMTFLY